MLRYDMSPHTHTHCLSIEPSFPDGLHWPALQLPKGKLWTCLTQTHTLWLCDTGPRGHCEDTAILDHTIIPRNQSLHKDGSLEESYTHRKTQGNTIDRKVKTVYTVNLSRDNKRDEWIETDKRIDRATKNRYGSYNKILWATELVVWHRCSLSLGLHGTHGSTHLHNT